jgi:hypothetical protein
MSYATDAPDDSFKIQSNGDISWGAGALFFNSPDQRLSIRATFASDAELTISDSNPGIQLSDESDTSQAIFNLVNGRIIIGGRSSTADPSLTEIITIYTGAPINSLSIRPNGNIWLGGSNGSIYDNAHRLALGTHTPLGEFTISSTTPDVWLHDESDTSETVLELNNGTVIFKGRSVDSNPLNSIISYHTGAPNSSLNIFNTGDIRMGSGFRFHQNELNSTLHIGESTTTVHSLEVSSAGDPELFLNNVNTSGAQLQMKANSFAIHMDTDGDSASDTFNVFSIHKDAPGNSLIISDTGNIGVGTSSPSYKMEITGDDPTGGDANTTALYITNNSLTNAGRVMLALENNGTPRFSFNNTSIVNGRWVFSVGTDASYRISKADTPLVEFKIDASGNVLAQGTFISLSDRNSKTGIEDLNSSEILSKVISLPLSSWSYKDNPDIRHVGPMAQDFYAAFKLGDNDKSIATIDTSGVALSAIQELARRNQIFEQGISELKAENAQLKTAYRELLSVISSQQERLGVIDRLIASENVRIILTSIK